MARRSKILGPNGEPVFIEDLTRDIAGPSMTGVRQPFSGDPASGLTPDRLGSILRRAEQGDPLDYFELAERIEERDLHYAAVLGTRKRSVAQIDVTVEAASDAAQHQRHAEVIREWLTRDELQDEVVDILDCIGKGLSFTEIVWDASEGQFRPARLEWRDPRYFTFDTADGVTPLLRGGVDAAIGGDAPLPAFKFIEMRFRAKSGLPIRGGLSRIACWAWMFKAYTQRDWAIFTQTYGQPIRIGRYHSGATAEEKAKLLQAVTNIAGDCAAIMPETMKIEFVESKSLGQSVDHYERRSDWLDRQVSKAVLGQTTTTDAISGGHAVSQEHREVQEDIERADAKALSAALNRDLVRPWIDLEFGPQQLYPRLVIARPEQKNVTMILDGMAKAMPMGLKVPKSFVYDLLGIPEPQGDEAVLESRPAVPPSVKVSGPGEPTALNDAGQDRGGDWLDRLAFDAGTVAAPGENALADKVRQMVDSAVSLEEVRDGLLALAPDMPATELADLMRLALAYAELAGEENAAAQRPEI